MVIAALVTFAVLLVAWIAAPSEGPPAAVESTESKAIETALAETALAEAA